MPKLLKVPVRTAVISLGQLCLFQSKYLPSLPLAPPPSYPDRSITRHRRARDFRTRAEYPATRSSAPLSAVGTFAGLGAIPAGPHRPDAGFCCGAVFDGSARGGQHLGNEIGR